MGREVRRVPPHWEHPRQTCEHSPWAGGCAEAKMNGGKCYQPLYDSCFEEAMQEWLDELAKWKESEFAIILAKHPADYNADAPYASFFDWHGSPPDPEYYRPKWTDASWFQLYETVSEGTPVTPPFETKDELVQYLADNGDFWYQCDVRQGRDSFRSKPTLEQARSLVDTGWAMSLMVNVTDEGAIMADPYQQQDFKNKTQHGQ